jgi:hypothetical protein
MFSLKPPRHISTLPECDLRRCPLCRRYWGMSGHAADMVKPTRMTHLRHRHPIFAVMHNAAFQTTVW